MVDSSDMVRWKEYAVLLIPIIAFVTIEYHVYKANRGVSVTSRAVEAMYTELFLLPYSYSYFWRKYF